MIVMNLLSLKPVFKDEDLLKEFNLEQINDFYKIFVNDFIDNPVVINGKKIKIAPVNSRIKEFNEYNESFVHVITRDTSKGRIYNADRANRIHWIKPILENSESKSILYFKWIDENNVCKEHFWFFKRDFIVVLKPISSDLMLVTAFCVDKDEKEKFYEKFKDFKDGNGTC